MGAALLESPPRLRGWPWFQHWQGEIVDVALASTGMVRATGTTPGKWMSPLRPRGKASQAWKPVISYQAMLMVGSLASLKEA
ncbi:hypothetical protein ACWGDS_33865 [Streptomyces sp. NPDC055059]